MRIVVINPNSTESMTDGMLEVARATLPAATIDGWTSRCGPPAIQGAADGALAVPPLLELVDMIAAQADAVVIGCFDDTGLAEAASRAGCPVLGIGQAAYATAALRQWRYSVITTLAVSVPVLEGNIRLGGFGGGLARVRASGVPVLDLERDFEAAAGRIAAEAQRALDEDGADCLVLGCAGMARLTARFRRDFAVPVIDGVEAAIRLAGALVTPSAAL